MDVRVGTQGTIFTRRRTAHGRKSDHISGNIDRGASDCHLILRICMTKFLACALAVFMAASVSTGRAAESATPDDTAHFLAGLRPSSGSPLNTLTKSAVWQRHAARFDSLFEQKDRDSLSKIHVFAAKSMPQSDRPLLYFFSGPDFLYANAFFGDASTYVMSGLEPAGEIPRLEDLNPGALAFTIHNTERSLSSVLNLSFFQTNDMRSQLSEGPVFGTVPLLYVFLARAGKTISEAETVVLDRDGNVKSTGADPKSVGTTPAPHDAQASHDTPGTQNEVRGVRIVFSDKSHPRQTLYYFGGDVSNDGLRKSGLLKFCATLGDTNAFIKSASYLLHREQFSDLREFLLKQSVIVLEDDSGIPLANFDTAKWELQPFGNYVGPIPLFRNRYQASLSQLFRQRDRKSIDFGLGYQWRRNTSNLLMATKKTPIL
jgi:hypothetical protein